MYIQNETGCVTNISSILFPQLKWCCSKSFKKESFKRKITSSIKTIKNRIERLQFDNDSARNDLFIFVLSTYVELTLDIWIQLIPEITNSLTVEELYDNLELLFSGTTNSIYYTLHKRIKSDKAVKLCIKYLSQYDKMFVGYLSVMTLKTEMTAFEIIHILSDMHISLCRVISISSHVTLPAINGDFDGVAFDNKVTSIRVSYSKRKCLDNLINIAKAIELKNLNKTTNEYEISVQMITDALNNDIIVYVTESFSKLCEYPINELIGMYPSNLNYINDEKHIFSKDNCGLISETIKDKKTTTTCTFYNYTKNNKKFKNIVTIKSIQVKNLPVFRLSIQFVPNKYVNIHSFKSYIDLLFSEKTPTFSTIYILENNKYKLVNWYCFEEVYNCIFENCNEQYLHDIIKIHGGETKLMYMINKPDDFNKVINIDSEIDIENKIHSLRNSIVLHSNNTEGTPYLIYVLHFKETV